MFFGAKCFYPVAEQNVGSHIFLPSGRTKCFSETNILTQLWNKMLGAIYFYPVAEGNVFGAIQWRNKILLGVMCIYPAAEQNIIGAICFYPVVEQNVFRNQMFITSCGKKWWEPYLSTQWPNKMFFGTKSSYPVMEQNVGSHIFLPSGGRKCFWSHPVTEQNIVGCHISLSSGGTKYYWS